MEYGITLNTPQITDNNYMKFVGYSENNFCIKKYFSRETADLISYKISELLQGVDPNNRKIIVPHNTIYSIMSSVYENYRPPTGDIYGRYNVPSGIGGDSYVQSMIDQVIEIITADVRTNLGMEENNSKLSIYTTILGDFNQHGLRSHPVIKTRVRRPNPMEFNMHY